MPSPALEIDRRDLPNRVIILFTSTVRDGGTNQYDATIASPTFVADQISRAALAYKSNDCVHAFNGVVGTVDTSGTMPTCDRARFDGGTSIDAMGRIYFQRMNYYNRRLPGWRLQELSRV